MSKLLPIAVGAVLLSATAGISASLAADHLVTALTAGGLTPDKQPFQIDNPGKGGVEAPGQGSPLSGEDFMTPATDQANSGQIHTPPPVGTKTAPSVHSNH